MKRVMIYAYTAHNFGDDLFIHVLCNKYPETSFYIYAPKQYKETFRHLDNLTVIRNDRFLLKVLHRIPCTRYLYREFRASFCDIGVYIGGSLFMERPRWKDSVHDFKWMLKNKSAFFVLGANFGPYQSNNFKQTYEQLFKTCTDVCFRDKASSCLFPDLSTVRNGRDIVLELETTKPMKREKTIIITPIFPSVRPHLLASDATYFRQLAAIAQRFIDDGFQIVWIAFCKKEQDDTAIERIIAHSPPVYQEQMQIYIYNGIIEEVLERIKNSSGVIATRFHAMILAAVYGKQLLPIIYSDKMTQVLHDHHFSGESIPLTELEDVDTERLTRILFSANNVLDMCEEKANEQFQVFDQYLSST